MRILAFDPGNKTGWALVSVSRQPYAVTTLDAGAFSLKPPRKTKPHPTPILRYYTEAVDLILRTTPDLVVIEDMFIAPKHQSLKTISGMYRPRLLLTLAANSLHIPTRDIAPSSWRAKFKLPRARDKALSLALARRLAPSISFLDSEDDKAEAVLIGIAAAAILCPPLNNLVCIAKT